MKHETVLTMDSIKEEDLEYEKKPIAFIKEESVTIKEDKKPSKSPTKQIS